MSNRRRIKRTKAAHTVETWAMEADTPGLQMDARPAADESVDRLLLGESIESISSALRSAHDRKTWEPFVIMRIAGRYNRTTERAEIVVAWPAASIEQIANDMLGAARAANSDAAAEALKSALGWSDV